MTDAAPEQPWYFAVPIHELDISVALYNIFKGRGVDVIGDLNRLTLKQVSLLGGFGAKRLKELQHIQNEKGVILKDEMDNTELVNDRIKTGDAYWSQYNALADALKVEKAAMNDDPFGMRAENKPWFHAIYITELDFNIREYNSVKGAGIMRLGDFSKITLQQLSMHRGIGKKSLGNIQAEVAAAGGLFQDDLQNATTIGHRLLQGHKRWNPKYDIFKDYNPQRQNVLSIYTMLLQNKLDQTAKPTPKIAAATSTPENKENNMTRHIQIAAEKDRRLEKIKIFDKKHNIDPGHADFAFLHVGVEQWDVEEKLKCHLHQRGVNSFNDLRLYNLSDLENQEEQNHAFTPFTADMRDDLENFAAKQGGWFFEDHEQPATVLLQIEKARICMPNPVAKTETSRPGPQPN